jgi:[ribosomal protein S5]-alanine N-acetyltransferase
MKNEFLTGKKANLRSLEETDLENIFNWLSDPDVTELLFYGYYPPNLQKLKEVYRKTIDAKHDLEFAVIDKETDSHVGWAGIYEIDWISKNAEFRIFIGDKKSWGKGISTESGKMLVDYAFKVLNLHRLHLGVNIENKASLKMVKNIGFQEEGVSKEGFWRDGKYYDLVKFGLINKA